MPSIPRDEKVAQSLAASIREFIDAYAAASGTTNVFPTGHRIPFHWPPHPISYNYLLHQSDWRGEIEADIHGETFKVELANTTHGVFGRSNELWVEALGGTTEEMLSKLRKTVEPLFKRQKQIAYCLGIEGRYQGHLNELEPIQLLKLLYCADRDVANDAHTLLETLPNKPDFLPALLGIIRDQKHEHRRSAQWCVLDMFEDLPSYCETESDEIDAINAITELLKNATDDYARTIYKAGVVLGGHLPDKNGGPALLGCLHASSKFGRRSAIHGLFHVVEWDPDARSVVVSALNEVAQTDSEPQLREFARLMANDIESASQDHIPEPVFEEEV
jgi:hypothetical protein